MDTKYIYTAVKLDKKSVEILRKYVLSKNYKREYAEHMTLGFGSAQTQEQIQNIGKNVHLHISAVIYSVDIVCAIVDVMDGVKGSNVINHITLAGNIAPIYSNHISYDTLVLGDGDSAVLPVDVNLIGRVSAFGFDKKWH